MGPRFKAFLGFVPLCMLVLVIYLFSVHVYTGKQTSDESIYQDITRRSFNDDVNISKLGVAKLEGSNDCDYSVPITIADQIFHVTIDTGSSALAIATPECCSKLGVSNLYTGPCDRSTELSVRYGSGFWKGHPATQEFSFAGIGPYKGTFGAMINQSSLVGNCDGENQIDETVEGIFGLSFPTLGTDSEQSFLDILCDHGTPNGFSIQLCGYPSAKKKQGNMWIGGWPSRFTTEPMKYAKLIRKDWYQVNILSFSINGTKIKGFSDLNSPHSIVDSGTSDLMLNTMDNLNILFAALQNSDIVQGFANQSDRAVFWGGTCTPNAYLASDLISTLSVELESDESKEISIPFPIKNLFNSCITDTGVKGLTFLYWGIGSSRNLNDKSDSSSSLGTILGSTLLEGYVVFFDRGLKSRIGFATGTNCLNQTSVYDIDNFASMGYCFTPPDGRVLYFQWWYLMSVIFGAFSVGFLVLWFAGWFVSCCCGSKKKKMTRNSSFANYDSTGLLN